VDHHREQPNTVPPRRESPLSEFLSKLLDDAIRIPGTKIGFGLDSIVGLVPGVGDLIGSSLSTVILVDALRMRVPIPILAQMAWNLLFDAALGLVPFVGDLADVTHRANRKNLKLLRASIEAEAPQTSARRYLLVGGLIVAAVLSLVIGAAGLGLWLLSQIVG
jgi:hypothetical protein